MNVLIIGQGIAGSLLAFELDQRGHHVCIIQEPNTISTSQIAAGIINPITGHRLVPTFAFQKFYTQAKQTYKTIEEHLNRQIFFPLPLRRFLINDDEMAFWNKKKDSPFFKNNVSLEKHTYSFIQDEMFSFVMHQSGYLNMPEFILRMREYLREHLEYMETRLQYDDIVLKSHSVFWRDKKFDCAIFCEGTAARNNPWFNELPFNFVKGEILTVKLKSMDTNFKEILNVRKWLLPMSNGFYKAGATYNPEDFDTNPTPEGKKEICDQFKNYLNLELDIVDHIAGVRPATMDLKPFIGAHHEHPNIYIFNGLGSKGALMAPWLASHLTNVLESKEELWEEAAISRFDKK